MFDYNFVLEIPNDDNLVLKLESFSTDTQYEIAEAMLSDLYITYQNGSTLKTMIMIKDLIFILEILYRKYQETSRNEKIYKSFIEEVNKYITFAMDEEGPFILPDIGINESVTPYADDLPYALEFSLSKVTKKSITNIPLHFVDSLVEINDRYFS
jgi:hypothetical protein